MAKTLISIRVETELLEWFKDNASHGYQVLMHYVLKSYQRTQLERMNKTLGRAQQIYLQYHAKCFWHLRRDLLIDSENIGLALDGLKKYGGIEGLKLAAELKAT